jgi:putative serine/threonine protein kinase
MLLMKLLEYQELPDWLGGLRGEGSRRAAREMVHRVLNQCRTLDVMGIDHGQLSNLRKHIVVAEGRPWIIDFESAGTSRRARNVTSAAQYLFIGGRPAPRVRRAIGLARTDILLQLLRMYKDDDSDFTYSKILSELKLAPD